MSVEARYLEPELPEELNAAYRRTFDRLRGHFRMRGISPEEAADMAQEAAIRAFVHVRRRGVTADTLGPLMNQIARNMLIDRHRRGGPAMVSLDDAEPAADPAQDPTEAVVSLEAARAVRAAVDALPERHRDAILLALAGMTPAQVGERLGIGRNAADALLHRARRSLKDRLRAAGQAALGLTGLLVFRARETGRRLSLRAGMMEAGAAGAFQTSVGAAAAAFVLAVNLGGSMPHATARVAPSAHRASVAASQAAGAASAGAPASSATSYNEVTQGPVSVAMGGNPVEPGGRGNIGAGAGGGGVTPHNKLFGIDYEVYDDGQPHEGPLASQTDTASKTTCGSSPEACEAVRQGVGGL